MNASCTTYILGVIHLLSGVNRQGMLLFLFNAARILQHGFCLRGITNASEAPKCPRKSHKATCGPNMSSANLPSGCLT